MSTSPIDRPSPGELVADVQRVVGAAKVVKRELEQLPWLGELVAAVQGTKKLRLHYLLRSIAFRQEQLGDEQRDDFKRYIGSEAGQELLTDYAETTVRTSSRTAIAALGILYAHHDDGRFSPGFRRNACEALDRISDDAVRLFLDLLKIAREIPNQPQRILQGDEYVTDAGIWHGAGNAQGVSLVIQPLWARLGLDPWTIRSRTNQLIARGLLLPDAGTRIDAQDYLTFAFGAESVLFEEVLTRAGAVIGAESPEGE